MDRVFAEHERAGDLAVRESGSDQPQDLCLAARQRRVAVRLDGYCVVEEPSEGTLKLALVVDVREVGVTPERNEPCVREEGRELTSPADGNGPIAPAMEHERGHRHAREKGPRVAVQLELEEGRREFGVGGMALVPAERSDLVAARVRDDQPGEHLRGERPVRPHEVDDRATRRVGQVVP